MQLHGIEHWYLVCSIFQVCSNYVSRCKKWPQLGVTSITSAYIGDSKKNLHILSALIFGRYHHPVEIYHFLQTMTLWQKLALSLDSLVLYRMITAILAFYVRYFTFPQIIKSNNVSLWTTIHERVMIIMFTLRNRLRQKFIFDSMANWKRQLERAVDGAPSQIPTRSSFWTPAPQFPSRSHNENTGSICDMCLSFICENTEFGIKIFEIDFVNEISWHLTFWPHPKVTSLTQGWKFHLHSVLLITLVNLICHVTMFNFLTPLAHWRPLVPPHAG